jgi:hypothetical protein
MIFGQSWPGASTTDCTKIKFLKIATTHLSLQAAPKGSKRLVGLLNFPTTFESKWHVSKMNHATPPLLSYIHENWRNRASDTIYPKIHYVNLDFIQTDIGYPISTSWNSQSVHTSQCSLRLHDPYGDLSKKSFPVRFRGSIH